MFAICFNSVYILQPAHLVELFQQLLRSPAPLVLHNGWLDLLFLYHACHAPLPSKHYLLKEELAEMFCEGGVYDTKVIARHLDYCGKKTFLEYIYKKAIIRNQQFQGVWLNLLASDYPNLDGCAVEEMALPEIPTLSELELMSIKICHTFAVSECVCVCVCVHVCLYACVL